MEISRKDKHRLQERLNLILSVNHTITLMALLLAVACFFFLNIKGVIPYALLGFALLNFLNTLLYKHHKNFILTYNLASVIAMTVAILVTLNSGGIQSPFIFVLAIIVFARYVTTKMYSRICLSVNLGLIILIFLHDISGLAVLQNTVPPASRSWFAFLSMASAVYLLGGVLGKNLLRAHHNLYRSRHEIQKRIEEKETLLKEVHHRVKNNLQTVSSLLSLQSRSVNDKKISNIIKSSQNRVVSMAMVHEMLYKREDALSKIEIKPYITELCNYLLRSVQSNTSNVELQLDVAEGQLSIDTVIPLGLIINEVLTNALKYGFKEAQEGKIYLSLHKQGLARYELCIGDDGVGYPQDVNPKNTQSLGLKLIYNLARQLKGTVTRDMEKKGTHYRIAFEEIVEGLNSVEKRH